MDNRRKAEELAGRGYYYLVSQDKTTTGEPAYVAEIAELEGCLGQGNTFDAAIADVQAAAVDYIESLLDHGLPVPAPKPGALTWRPVA